MPGANQFDFDVFISYSSKDLAWVRGELLPRIEQAGVKAFIDFRDFTAGADQDLAWRQLLTALGRPPEPEPPKEPRREQWFLAHPYPMPPNFTGRVAERAMLD